MTNDLIDFVGASFISLVAWFFGGLDGFLKVLLTFAIIDYVSGVSVAFTRHELSSAVGFNGIARKIMMFLLVGIAHVIDTYLFGNKEALKLAVCLFYISNEGVSILENVNKLGIPIPQFLKDKLLQLSDNNSQQPKPLKKPKQQ